MRTIPFFITHLLFLMLLAASAKALPPNITLNSPINYYNTTLTNITLNFTALSDLETSLTCNLTINNIVNLSTILVINNTPQITAINGFNDGTYHWNVTCRDNLNNTNKSATRNFTIDTLPPTTRFNGTSATLINPEQTVYVGSRWKDTTTGIKIVELIVNGIANNTNATSLAAGSEAIFNFSYAVSSSQIGSTLNFTINATDYAGNEMSTEIMQVDVVDNLPPSLVLLSPINGHNSSNTNVSLQFNVTDNYASVVYCNITLDGVMNITTNDTAITSNKYKTITTLITGLSDLMHYWNITCWDSSNNKNISATRKFSVDIVPPIISNLRNTSTINENSYIEFDCNENCNYSISWYNSVGVVGSLNNNTFATSHKSFLSSLANSTTYFVNLTVWDIVGNKAVNNTFNFTTAKSIVADITPPIINLDAPLNITTNVTLLFANFSDDGGLGGLITINELSDNSNKKNITFKSNASQGIYLNLPKKATITSATLDLRGYSYNDYVYYSFENEYYTSLQGGPWGGEWSGFLFGYISGAGTFNPHVIIKTVPIDFTLNKIKIFYRREYGDDIAFHYQIGICNVDNSNTCINPVVQIVDDFRVYDYENNTQDIVLNNTYNLKKGERYKIKFSCLENCKGIPSTYYVGHVGNSDELLFYHNIAEYPARASLLKIKLFPVPENPKSPSIDIGNNSIFEWAYSGSLLNTTTVSNLTTATNNYLSTCQADNNGYCSVPIVFNSQSIGIMDVSNINVKYPGNNSCEVCIASDGICDTEWTINNVTNTLNNDYLSGNCSYSWNASNYNDGIYKVSIRIKDTAYNTGISSKKITLDRDGPIFKYYLPSDNGAFNVNRTNNADPQNATFELTFQHELNDLSPISNCSIIINGMLNQTHTLVERERYRKFIVNLSTSISGIQYNNWSIKCFDILGFESNTDTRKFSLIVIGNFSGDTTDFSKVNMSRIENLTFEKVNSGKIKFSDFVDLSGIANIDDYVKLSYNKIEIDAGVISLLNKTATLYMYNLTYNQTPKIIRNNITCPDTICKIINYSNGTLIFNVTQFSIYTTEEVPVTSGGDSGGSSGSSGSSGGGGGGGGGGGAAGFICNMEWKCSEWSACEEGSETRQCNFVKVPQHWQETQCPILSDAPINSQKCEVKIINPATTIAETKDQSNPISAESSSTTIPQINGSANQITGNFIARLASNPKAMKELIIGASIMATAVFGIFGYKFAYKRKQSIK